MTTGKQKVQRPPGPAKGRGQRNTRAAAPPRKATGRSWLRRLAVWSLVAAIWLGVGLGVVVIWYAYTLPELGAISQMTRRPNVTLLARDGSAVASFGGVYGTTVEVKDLPPDLPHAVLAIEDRRFYEHFGVDLRGLARAIYQNLRQGRIVQGGSTITQQLAKNLFLTADRTYHRKFQELILAFWLEQKFTKDQILTIYLNRVYFGAGAYGVDAAARHYFGKPATEVSLFESALLAGLLKAPSRLNPLRNADRAEARAALVLNAMADSGFISDRQLAGALAPQPPRPLRSKESARYFSDWIMAQVSDYLGGIDQDIQVRTTLDPRLQAIAERELEAFLDGEGAERNATQAALVSLAPTGAVLAMLGGRDYSISQFNRANQALRQPGSAFKLFTYMAALENGALAPDSKLLDAPVRVGDWEPRNYAGKYYGEVTLRESFARSLNSVAVRMALDVGPQKIAAAARRLGITSDLRPNGGLALGASEVTLLELTGAYATFANRGEGVWPYGILDIRDANGTILYQRPQRAGPGRVVAPRVIEQMNDLMTASVAWGTGKAAKQTRPAAGKTGTSQDFRDAWFIGFTAELVTGVWFGNDDNAPMKKVTGGGLPARLWARVMQKALDGEAVRALPDGGQDAVADSGGGFIERLLKKLSREDGEKAKPDTGVERFFP